MARIRLSHASFETLGSFSLVGMFAEARGDDISDKTLIVEIDETSLSWREKNNGPMLVIMPEFVPRCIMQDMISLLRQGIDVRFEENVVSPK